MEIIFASGNQNKALEFQNLLDSHLFKLILPSEKIDVIEDGADFSENALLKARAYYNFYKKPVFSDDSGLIVDALPGELGIHSARFGGPNLNQAQRIELLLEKLKDIKKEHRTAHFVCVLCFYFNPEEIFFFEGRVNGSITERPSGSDGFGYDPVFCPNDLKEGMTLAMNSEWKGKNSHRAEAAKAANDFFREKRLPK